MTSGRHVPRTILDSDKSGGAVDEKAVTVKSLTVFESDCEGTEYLDTFECNTTRSFRLEFCSPDDYETTTGWARGEGASGETRVGGHSDRERADVRETDKCPEH